MHLTNYTFFNPKNYLYTNPIKGLRGYGLSYRFQFNGKELDNETYGEGNAYDYGARIYNPRLGRFLSIDPEAKVYPAWSTYAFVRNNPILRVDPTGKWDIEVHVYKDREKYGYGTAIVKDRHGKEVYRFEIRAQGTAGADRMKEDANTPLGTYDIPDQGMWKGEGSRKSYGPNPRLILNPESGEIKESNRDDIRIHGGRQEEYDEATGKWTEVKDPQLKKTHGCLRAFDEDVATLKSVTGELMKNDSKEKGGKLTIVDDLEKKDGKYVVPNNNSNAPTPPANDKKNTKTETKKTGGS